MLAELGFGCLAEACDEVVVGRDRLVPFAELSEAETFADQSVGDALADIWLTCVAIARDDAVIGDKLVLDVPRISQWNRASCVHHHRIHLNENGAIRGT